MKLIDRLAEAPAPATGKPDASDRSSQDAAKPSDVFPRLSLEMCAGDDGTRPADPSWPGAGVWWASPAIGFDRPEPFTAGSPLTIYATIRNLGNADATGGFLEAAYNVWLGNEAQGMETFCNLPLPVIPAGGVHVAEIPWIPPDADSTHACVHVRVFDFYSLANHAGRVLSWYSYENPQAANRNVRLALIEDEAEPVVIEYKVRNHGKGPLSAQILVTRVDALKRAADVDEKFPLPFTGPMRTASAVTRRRLAAAGGRWPREEMQPRFDHSRFGIATRPVQPGKLRAGVERSLGLRSFEPLRLAPGEVRHLQVVIPVSELPSRGHDALFQVDYQVGGALPVQHFVRVSR